MRVARLRITLVAIAVFFASSSALDACTIFNSTEGKWTLVGNNEDYAWHNAFIRFVPAGQGFYGTMTMFNDGSQGGMNDQGLFYDWNALSPQRQITPDPNKMNYPGYLAFKILRECATVEDVLAMYKQYNDPIFSRAQIQWVDATGASVICGYGETEYQYQLKKKAYQVSTNFNVFTSKTTDWRFDMATANLDSWRNISVAGFSWLLSQVQQGSTVYSNIYDLVARKMYVHCHYPAKDFGHMAVVDIQDELAKGLHDVYLKDLTYLANSDVIFPAATALSPANFDLHAAPDTNLSITFQGPVFKGPGGNITIKRYSDDATIEVIEINTVGGLGTSTLTIDPSQDLSAATGYYVQIDDTCLVDAAGHPYHGMTSKQSWFFGTFSRTGSDPGSQTSTMLPNRAVKPLLGPRRALVMMLSHESLKPSAIGYGKMRQLMDGVKEIFAVASHHTFSLESVIVPEPVLLPGNYSDYDDMPNLDLYAIANKEVLQKYGSEMDSNRFEVLVYFFPTDTNASPFGQTEQATYGLRYKPAVANIGLGLMTTPEAIAHEIGHGYFFYGHAASGDPQTGEVLKWAGDPYELMGYGVAPIVIPLRNPSHIGLIYRYYWGWTTEDEITPVTESGTHQLDPGKALLLSTNKNTPLWLELIRAEQAYGNETGYLLVRADRASQNGIYHTTLDMTPGTNFQPDLYMTPGQSITFEGRKITFVKNIADPGSPTPSAEITIEASGSWLTPQIQVNVSAGPAPLAVDFNAFTAGNGEAVQYDWQFGDNGSAEGLATSHTFLQPGQCPVTLTVTDDQGSKATAVVTITVEPSRRLIPFYQQGTDSWTGIAVSNYSNADADVQFRLFGPSGETMAGPVTRSLASGRQFAQLGWEIFGLSSEAPSEGWIELQSANPHLGSFFIFGGGSALDGSVDSLRCGKEVHFTRVFQGPKAWRRRTAATTLSLVNATSQAANVDLTLRVPTGASSGETEVAASASREIPAFGCLHESIEELFGNVTVSDGYVTAVTSGGASLLGFALTRVETPAMTIGLSGISEDISAPMLFSAQLASAEGVYTSLRLFNLADEPRRVWLTPISEDGTGLGGVKTLDLAAGGAFQQEMGTFFGFDPASLSVGSLRVDFDGPGIVGDVIFGTSDDQCAAAMPLQGTLARKAVFSQVANIPDSFYTGMALHNPQRRTAEVAVKVWTADGTEAGTGNVTLAPGARISKLLTELAPSSTGVIGGYVTVESTEPVVVQQVYGDFGQTLMAAVPPTVIE
jgi:PKD repeat protein